MKTLKLTARDFKETKNYWREYVGKTDVSKYDGNIEIEGNLGYVRFASIAATGSICALAGSGIEAGEGIKAGWGIKAGLGIKAGSGIKAGWGIEAGSGIEAGEGIEAGLGIVSLYSWVKAKLKIKVDARCTIAAGLFSFSGPQEIEAQEIDGNVVYGVKKLLPKDEAAKSAIGAKRVTVKLGNGNTIEIEGELVE